MKSEAVTAAMEEVTNGRKTVCPACGAGMEEPRKCECGRAYPQWWEGTKFTCESLLTYGDDGDAELSRGVPCCEKEIKAMTCGRAKLQAEIERMEETVAMHVAGMSALVAFRDQIKRAARDLIRQIVYDYPGATGWTVLMDHEPLYRLAELIGGPVIRKEDVAHGNG